MKLKRLGIDLAKNAYQVHGIDKARDFSAWLGIVPNQHSSGGKNRLGAISKRGDTYLRTLLIHGARSCIKVIEKSGGRHPYL